MTNAKYVKDEYRKRISPVTSISSVYDNNTKNLETDMRFATECIFIGKASGISMSIGAFKYFTPTTSLVDRYGKFSTSNGYTIPYSGWYEIETQFHFAMAGGNSSNINTGFCVNKSPADTDYSIWQQQKWRLETNNSAVVKLSAGATIQFQYYLDSSYTPTIDNAFMTIKLLCKDSIIYATHKKVNQKYLKDENDEVFSPIVSGSSIYLSDGSNLKATYDKKITLDMVAYQNLIKFTSTTDTINIKSLTAISGSRYFNNSNNLVNATSNGLPRFIAMKSGYYNVLLTARINDAVREEDYRFIVTVERITTGGQEQYYYNAGRKSYRCGAAGWRAIYLNRGDVIYPRFWTDGEFAQIQYLTFMAQSLTTSGSTSDWTLEEAKKVMAKYISTYNGCVDSATFGTKTLSYAEEEHTVQEYIFSVFTNMGGERYFHFSRNGGGFHIEEP